MLVFERVGVWDVSGQQFKYDQTGKDGNAKQESFQDERKQFRHKVRIESR